MEKEIILVVDDTPDNLTLMSGLLQETYTVKVANNGEKALKIAMGEIQPDLILLDIMMPKMDGYEVCRRLKADDRTKDIPVIFITAKAEMDDEKMGLELGAVDYITKPISPSIVMARLQTHLKLKLVADFHKNQNIYLETEVANRTKELLTIQDITILAMASLAETRDNETGYHIRRTQLYVQALAKKLQNHPSFADVLTNSFIELLVKSAPLHDIGKVGIPDSILLKPGRLTTEEFEIMKSHVLLGRASIEKAEDALGKKVAFLEFAKENIYYHHEKWDGTGYLEGIAGNEIPIAARLMAVADVYDALISRRVYKPAMTHQQAMAIIVDGRGKHFDPDMVDAFVEINEEFQTIAGQYVDHEG